MVVCNQCLSYLTSREGKQIVGPLVDPHIHYGFFNEDGSFTETAMFDGDGEDYVECEWCGEMIPANEGQEV